MVFTSLPPPRSGTLLEVQFRRLLQKCIERTEQSEAWKRDPKFHAYVDVLQEQLSMLKASSVRLEDGLMDKYTSNTKLISNALLSPDVPLFCKKIPTAGNHGAAIRSMPEAQKNRFDDSEEDQSSGSSSPGGLQQLGTTARKEIEAQMHIQDALTDELVDMASQLKHRTKAVEKAVDERNAALDEVDTRLNQSVEAASNARKRAGIQLKKGKLGTCMTCMVLLGVGFVFTAMLVFIRFTSLVGYKAKRTQPNVPDTEEL